MVRSEWLPTMPLHVAIWSQIVMEADLSWVDQGKALRLLANAWSSGELARKPWATTAAWQAAERMWGPMLAERQKATAQAERNSARAAAAAAARWDALSNAPSMLQACSKHPPSIARSKHPDPEPEPEPEPYPEPDQKPSSLRSEGARRQAPPDLELTQPRFEYGVEQGLTVEAVGEEWEAFTDHRYRTPRTKWDLAWKAWVRKAVQIRGIGSSRRGPPPRTAAGRTMSNVEQFLKQSGAL